jgi:hypothetical protein
VLVQYPAVGAQPQGFVLQHVGIFDLLNTFGLFVIALLGAWNRRTLSKMSIEVNGRMNELLELTKKSSHAEGRLEGEAVKREQNHDVDR